MLTPIYFHRDPPQCAKNTSAISSDSWVKKMDVLNLFQSKETLNDANESEPTVISTDGEAMASALSESPGKKEKKGIQLTDENERLKEILFLLLFIISLLLLLLLLLIINTRRKWIGTPLVIPGKVMFIFKRNRRFHSVWGDSRMYPLEVHRLVFISTLRH